jgi:competence protein ComEC
MNWRANFVYLLIGGFGIGVLTRSFFDFGFPFTLFTVLVSIVAVLLYINRRHEHMFMAAMLLLGVALGIARFDIAALNTGDWRLDVSVGTKTALEGIVIDEPDQRETNTKLTVLAVKAGGAIVDAKTLIIADPFQTYHYGDRVVTTGVLSKPMGFVGDDGRYFDYRAYLGKDDIFYQMLFPEVEVIGSREGNPVKGVLFAVKNVFLGNIARVIPEPQSSLLGGLVVGAKQSLGENLLEDFRRTGIIHIVVLSGYNITIVIEFIKRIFSRLGGTVTNVGSVITIALFVMMTGASATSVRAGIMGGLVILARSTGRTYDLVRALFIAGFLMVLVNPKILVFDVSFQLSFMATLGLIYLAPRLEQYFGWLPSRWQFREFATATIATQLFVLPILLSVMGDVSLVALPVNLLVLGIIPITMLAGFVTGIVGFLGTAVSLPFGLITTALLSYQLAVVDLFSAFPFAVASLDTFPAWAAMLCYVVLGVVLWRLSVSPRRIVSQRRSS